MEETKVIKVLLLSSQEIVVSETVSSASTAYIRTHDTIAQAESDPESPLPRAVLDMGRKLLDEGYPSMAERVVELDLATANDAEQSSILPTWAWVVVAVVAILLIVIVAAIWWWINRSPPPLDDDD